MTSWMKSRSLLFTDCARASGHSRFWNLRFTLTHTVTTSNPTRRTVVAQTPEKKGFENDVQ
jgi:hypothetical protein